MQKIHLQNLVLIVDEAVKKGLIHPDDLVNVGLSRKAAIDMIAQLDEGQSVAPVVKDDQPNESKSKSK